MSPVAPGELLITRQARWIVTLELLETSLRLSWSPLGAPETSRASTSDVKSLFDANLSSQLDFEAANINDLHGLSTVLQTFTFLILRSFFKLSKSSAELFWATLSFILGLKRLLRSSLGAASGSLRAHNHSTGSMDRDLGALGALLEAPLVASRWPRDLQSLRIRCPELFRTGVSLILTSPQLILNSQNEILSSHSSFQSTSAA